MSPLFARPIMHASVAVLVVCMCCVDGVCLEEGGKEMRCERHFRSRSNKREEKNNRKKIAERPSWNIRGFS